MQSASRSRGRGRSSRGGAPRANPPSRKQLHDELRGTTLKTPLDPPNYVDKPWNHATIVLGAIGDQTVTPASFLVVALAQLGFVSSQTLEFRFMAVRAWALSASRPMRIACYGYTGGAVKPLAVIQDWGTLQRAPHVGYKWPASVSMIVWNGISTDTIFTIDVGTAEKIPWIAYIQCLWRSDIYNPIAMTVRGRMSKDKGDQSSTSGSLSSFFGMAN